MASRYRHILFDADGTLFDFIKAEENALRLTCTDFNLMFTDEFYRCYHKINNELWKKHELGLIGKVDLISDRFRLTFDLMNITDIDCESFNHAFIGYLGEGCFLIPKAFEVCAELCRTHTLSIITNGSSAVQKKRFALSPLPPFFCDRLFISEEMGVQKPMKEYFTAVLSALNADPGECIVIGDSLSSDMRGAANAGIDACWFNPSHSVNYTDVKYRYEISDLYDILSII